MSDHRVTWLIPVLNGMPYLTETLASIEAQTYTNWEVLVWDNGSTDGTIEELKQWIPNRLPGRLITGKPLTLGGSLAQMVEICKTELCARIDADDINLPDRLEKQVEFLSSHPEISVLGSWMYVIDEHGLQKEDLYTLPLKHDDIIHEMLIKNTIAHPSVIFRRSTVLDVGNYRDLYFQKWKVNIEDYDLWLRILQYYKFANLDIPLVKYRVHQNSTTQIAIRENRLEKARLSCLCENALHCFGISDTDMKLLQERKQPFAIFLIIKIAKYLQQNNGNSLLNILRSISFNNTVKYLIAPTDIISRLAIAALAPDRLAFPKELGALVSAGTLRYPRRLRKLLRQHQLDNEWKKEKSQWFLKQKNKFSVIDPSIYFTGNLKPNLDLLKIGYACYIEKELSLWISDSIGSNSKITINDNVYIARNVFIGAFQPIYIGKYTQIGAYTYIISGSHSFSRRDIPINQQGFIGEAIVIEDDVWIGTHVVILPGVTIGTGSIIAAHSLVNKNVPPYEVWGGVPAKFIKKRL